MPPIGEAVADDKVVAIHAAMGGGTGLNHFEKYFADRTYDVGIAEQHAVTFAAGLACEGLKPILHHLLNISAARLGSGCT